MQSNYIYCHEKHNLLPQGSAKVQCVIVKCHLSCTQMRPSSHLAIFLFGKGTLAQDYTSPDERLACWLQKLGPSSVSSPASANLPPPLGGRTNSAGGQIVPRFLRWRRQLPHCTQGLWHTPRQRGAVAWGACSTPCHLPCPSWPSAGLRLEGKQTAPWGTAGAKMPGSDLRCGHTLSLAAFSQGVALSREGGRAGNYAI